MKPRILLLFLLLPVAVYADYGDNILWRYSFGLSDYRYSKAPAALCGSGYQAIFLHTNPYKINTLRWDYAAGGIGRGRWGVSGSFRSYNLEDLFNNTKVSFAGAFRLDNHLYFSLEAESEREKFSLDDAYNRIGLIAAAQYVSGFGSVIVGLRRLTVTAPYDNFNKFCRPYLNFSSRIAEYSSLAIGYTQLNETRGQWHIWHGLSIEENFSLDFGYQTYPELLQCGLDFGWKKIKFSLIYQGIDKLNDTIIWGISTRK